ncbi:MAG: hypothetical protein IT442_10795 [Phycisphaeraceae bacterium]|nr:hypothetical protein [Phycisphaeraceae bacterium]
MLRDPGHEPMRCCPFIDREDPRCAAHFSLPRLAQAFGICVNDYARCATYRELCLERPGSQIVLRIKGRPLAGFTAG